MYPSLLTIAGPVVSKGTLQRLSITVNRETGLIHSVQMPDGNEHVNYPDSCLIFAGFGDIHVHAREDVSGKHLYKESFRSASLAALNGGVTHIADMPNNPVPPVDDASWKAKHALTVSSHIPLVIYAGIGPATLPLSVNVPYKAFMGPSIGDLFFKDDETLTQTLARYAGLPISFHCEDPVVLDLNREQSTHERRRPAMAEIRATDLALALIRTYGLRGKLCHYSTGDGLQKILRAKMEGVDVTCEVTPTHLFFDQSMLTPANHKWLQMNPPLRENRDKDMLLDALKNGDIDYLATDHAPHSREEKEKGTSGVTHLDTYGAFVTWLISEKQVPVSIIEQVCAVNPGRFSAPFLDPSRIGAGLGEIKPGYMANLTVLNMKKPVTIKQNGLRTQCGWSPFEGFTFPGSVEDTWIGGFRRSELDSGPWL
ncbi:MAG: amidohydrolase family protein [Bacteroidetes bacterium]|nr:amidohydrolase family protein [Bacteroidota bacterium]